MQNFLFIFLTLVTIKVYANEGYTSKRGLEVMKCAQCHQDVFKQWQEGPHSNTNKMLEQHKRETFDIKKFDPHYKEKVRVEFDSCLQCHISTNVYEELYSTVYEGKSDEYIKQFLAQDKWKGMKPRVDVPSRETGVDCLTCHVKDGQVLTRENYHQSKDFSQMKDFCNPKPTKFFSSEFNCFACHQGTNVEMWQIQEKTGDKSMSCMNCHFGENKEGHFIPWHSDDNPERKLKYSALIFQSFKFQKNKAKLQISWKNDFKPHGFNGMQEFYVTVRFLNASKQLAEDVSRINSREGYLEKWNRRYYKGDPIPGITGDPFNYGEPGISKSVSIPKNTDTILVKAYRKSHFMIDNSYAELIIEKKFELAKVGAQWEYIYEKK